MPVQNDEFADYGTWDFGNIGPTAVKEPEMLEFEHARVIEIPTPRWTAYDARYYGVEISEAVPMSNTERAYTSSIWYSP